MDADGKGERDGMEKRSEDSLSDSSAPAPKKRKSSVRGPKAFADGAGGAGAGAAGAGAAGGDASGGDGVGTGTAPAKPPAATKRPRPGYITLGGTSGLPLRVVKLQKPKVPAEEGGGDGADAGAADKGQAKEKAAAGADGAAAKPAAKEGSGARRRRLEEKEGASEAPAAAADSPPADAAPTAGGSSIPSPKGGKSAFSVRRSPGTGMALHGSPKAKGAAEKKKTQTVLFQPGKKISEQSPEAQEFVGEKLHEMIKTTGTRRPRAKSASSSSSSAAATTAAAEQPAAASEGGEEKKGQAEAQRRLQEVEDFQQNRKPNSKNKNKAKGARRSKAGGSRRPGGGADLPYGANNEEKDKAYGRRLQDFGMGGQDQKKKKSRARGKGKAGGSRRPGDGRDGFGGGDFSTPDYSGALETAATEDAADPSMVTPWSAMQTSPKKRMPGTDTFATCSADRSVLLIHLPCPPI